MLYEVAGNRGPVKAVGETRHTDRLVTSRKKSSIYEASWSNDGIKSCTTESVINTFGMMMFLSIIRDGFSW